MRISGFLTVFAAERVLRNFLKAFLNLLVRVVPSPEIPEARAVDEIPTRCNAMQLCVCRRVRPQTSVV